MVFCAVPPYHGFMRFFSLVILGFLVLNFQTASAYELMVVQAVSSSKHSFVTRNGKRQGVTKDMTATFVSDDVAVIAKALTVTSQFTQWELVNTEGTVPFQVGSIVTYHPAQEYLWSLNPAEARQRYVEKLRPQVKHSTIVKAAATRGLSETTSNAAPASSSRGGVALDALYERLWKRNFAWDAGIRYENEVINLTGGSLITQRLVAMADILYYFDAIDTFYGARFFLSAGAGYGQSSTEADGIVQSGNVLLLPSAKIGVSLPFNQGWDFIAESAFETIKTSEKLDDGSRQETTQSNLRIGLGLRRYF